MIKLEVSSTTNRVSIMYVTYNKVSIAIADNLMNGRWLISRVNVHIDSIGQGIGSILLQNLISEVKKYEPDTITVSHGCYDGDIEKQYGFYRNNGFNGEGFNLLTYIVNKNVKMSRKQAIDIVSETFHLDSELQEVNELGKELMLEAMVETRFNWRELPIEVLKCMAEKCEAKQKFNY